MGARQRGQIIRNGDGSFSIRYYLASGKRKQEGTFATRTAANRRLREALREVDIGGYAGDVTFSELADRWYAIYDRAPATRDRVRFQLEIAKREFGGRRIREITPEEIGEWRLRVSAGQRHQVHGLIRQVLEAGVRWGYSARNPARLVDNPSTKKDEVRWLRDWSQVDAVAEEIGEYGPLVVFASGTGLRPNEWCALERRDIDLEGRVLYVERSWTEKGGLVLYTKTTRRRVPLRSRVIDAIRDELPKRGLVFRGDRGARVRLSNWRPRFWTPAVEAAGLDRLVPYAMRHTYAAWSLAAGVNVYALSRRMGTSMEMIDRTYGHLVDDADALEVGLLDEFDSSGR